ncbi:ras-related and estrogen-regulated growth inhibitor-like [Hoplias malabaricus]|uniref:ras-related and estrogen-regulated growth inhibitor-like n=1 Tax=Hoplias malabaricus TaxID=27720 RepID=UPI0034620365
MSSSFALSRSLRRTGSFPSARTVRIVILGQAAVGKTALAVRFITKRFIGEYDPTLETIYRHEVTIGGEAVIFEILDTAGQEEDALMVEEKIKWGDAFVIVYSVTDRCSFDEVMRLCFLVNHIHAAGGRRSGEPPPILIVANKKDLEFDRMVTPEDGETLSRGLKLPLREISVRDGWEETAAVFHALYSHVLQVLHSSPPSFRRRTGSRMMDKIPRIHSNSALTSTGRSFSFGSFRDLLPD